MKTDYLIIIIILIFSSCRKNESKPSNDSESETTETTSISEVGDSLYKAKFRDYETGKVIDSIVSIDDLEEDLFQFDGFDYPKFQVKSDTESEMVLNKGDNQVVIKSGIFNANNKKLTNSEDGYLIEIDDKPIYGTDGNMPRNEISDFYLMIKGNQVSVPIEQYEDLFEPNLKCTVDDEGQKSCYINAYEKENGEIIITMLNGDAAGSYAVIFFFDSEGAFRNRVIGNVI